MVWLTKPTLSRPDATPACDAGTEADAAATFALAAAALADFAATWRAAAIFLAVISSDEENEE